jgi:hypothetical protein
MEQEPFQDVFRPYRLDEEGRRRIGEFWYRALEIIPGAIVWATIIISLVASFVAPLWVIFYIIAFDIFWLYRVVHFCGLVIVAWSRFRRARVIDWESRIQALPRVGEIKHAVFLPTVHEPIEVLRATLKVLAECCYPNVKENMIVILGGEERVGGMFPPKAEILQREFGRSFLRLMVTIHPADLPGEIIGKGSNQNWMGHKLKEMIDSLGIPYENVIVSAFDCDTVVHPQYFSHLTYKYLTHPNPTRSSYQPMVLYDNNIWQSSGPVRVAAFGTSFWLMAELVRPERLSTFSSHSMPFKALVDVGFWQKDIVSEDSRIFLQCLVHYDGNYTVTPLYVPVAMDAISGEGFWGSVKNLYKQQRRWAWGIENFPFLVSRLRGRPNFPLREKIYYVWNIIEGMFTWATAPLLIFVLGRLPLLVAEEQSRVSVFFQNAPHTLEILMTIAMIGVFFSAVMSLTMLPPPPSGTRRSAWLIFFLQWAMVPITFTLLGSFPAIDAQTRLMLGKYMGFNVTVKKR